MGNTMDDLLKTTTFTQTTEPTIWIKAMLERRTQATASYVDRTIPLRPLFFVESTCFDSTYIKRVGFNIANSRQWNGFFQLLPKIVTWSTRMFQRPDRLLLPIDIVTNSQSNNSPPVAEDINVIDNGFGTCFRGMILLQYNLYNKWHLNNSARDVTQ